MAVQPEHRRWIILGAFGLASSLLLTIGVALLGIRDVASASPEARARATATRTAGTTYVREIGGAPRSSPTPATTVPGAIASGASNALRVLRRAGRADVTPQGARRMALGGAVPFADDGPRPTAMSSGGDVVASLNLGPALDLGPSTPGGSPSGEESTGTFLRVDGSLELSMLAAPSPTPRASSAPVGSPAQVTASPAPATATRAPAKTPVPAPTQAPARGPTQPPAPTSAPIVVTATPVPAPPPPIIVTATPAPQQRQIVVVVTPTPIPAAPVTAPSASAPAPAAPVAAQSGPVTAPAVATAPPAPAPARSTAPGPSAPAPGASAPSAAVRPIIAPPAVATAPGAVPMPAAASSAASAAPAKPTTAAAAPAASAPPPASRSSESAPILAERPAPRRAPIVSPPGPSASSPRGPAVAPAAAAPASAAPPRTTPREPSPQEQVKEQLSQRALTAVNTARAQAGALPLGRHAGLETSAGLHAQYDVANGQSEGNFQAPATPLFFGETPPARVARANLGRVPSLERIGELMALGEPEPERVVQEWLDSVFHRALLLDLQAQYLGYGQHADGAKTSAVLDLAGRREPGNASGAFPNSGATEVPTRCLCDDFGEAAGKSGPFGYPVTLLLGATRPPSAPTVARLTEGDDDGSPVPAELVDAFGNPTLVPSAPLKPNTRYTARFSWNGGPDLRWSFTTGK